SVVSVFKLDASSSHTARSSHATPTLNSSALAPSFAPQRTMAAKKPAGLAGSTGSGKPVKASGQASLSAPKAKAASAPVTAKAGGDDDWESF
ncbi:MAG: hypothetical protein K2Q97_17235, partial [Burkholderiaceae bacterium]|nr:hypothetical protein [Burkholderiaceae bacterium]